MSDCVRRGTAELLSEKASELMSAEYIQKYLPRMQRMGWTVEEMAADYSEPIRITPIKRL